MLSRPAGHRRHATISGCTSPATGAGSHRGEFHIKLLIAALALVAGGWTASAPTLYEAACTGSLGVQRTGTVRSSALGELSGIVASRSRPGTYWVVNDSGGGSRVYAIGASGRLRQTVRVSGAPALDWEDIALGPGPSPGRNYLYVADIGDNDARRRQIEVVRIPEPVPGQTAVRATRIVLRYPDGPRDAEALVVDPRRGTFVIVAKAIGGARVYEGRARGGTLRRAGSVFTLAPVTGASVSARGDVIALRTYLSVLLWRRSPGTSLGEALGGRPCAAPAPPEQQGEAVAISANGRRLVTVGEGARPPVYAIAPVQKRHAGGSRFAPDRP